MTMRCAHALTFLTLVSLNVGCDNSVSIGANLDAGTEVDSDTFADAHWLTDADARTDAAHVTTQFTELEAGGGEGSYSDPRLVIDPENVEHVFARTGTGVVHFEWHGDSVERESLGGVALTVDADVDADNRLHLVQITAGSCDVQYRVRDDGAWSAITTIDDTLDECESPSIDLAIDSRGRPHVVYYDDATLSLHYASKLSDWTHSQIDVDARGASWVAVAVDSEDQPHVVTGGAYVGAIQHLTLDDAGALVSNESVLATSDTIYGVDLVIDASDQVRLVAAVHPTGLAHRLLYAVRTGPNAWSNSFLNDDGVFDPIHPTLALSESGATAIGVSQYADGRPYVLMAPDWETRRLSSSTVSTNVVVAFGGDELPRIVFARGFDPHVVLLRGE